VSKNNMGMLVELWSNYAACGEKSSFFRPVYHGLATSKYGGLQATAKRAFRA